MCGIVGFTFEDKKRLKKAQAVIQHRGPNSQGTFFDEQISLGHNRLSIIDLSSGGNQPMQSADRKFIIVFNGEIYNYKAIRQELEVQGCQFVSQSDTEVILQGYQKWGTEVFSRLRGMWALAIYDKHKKEVVLARDHFGIKPLYYSLAGGKLSFASELKVFPGLLEKLTPNKEAYYQFFNFGYFIDPETCYREVKKLEPGRVARYRIGDDRLVFETAQLLETEKKNFVSSFEEAVLVLDESLLDSLQAHYVADVPVGLLLSGGNDSSLLAALSVASGKKPIAYHVNIQDSLDSKYARKVAKQLELELDVVSMEEKELEEQYEKIWNFVDEPTADSSVIPTSLVYSKIKKGTKVVLSGEGGDEMFGGYRRHEFLWRHNQMRSNSLVFSLLNQLQGSSEFSLHLINPILTRLRNTSLEKTDDVISAYLSVVCLANRSFDYEKIRKVLLECIGENRKSNNLFFDRNLYLPNDLMFKNDIASMASSIEARVPFLDKVLFNTTLNQIKPEYCLSEKYQSKLILKKVMEKYLPKDLIYRPKKGFSFSFQKYQFRKFFEDTEQAMQFHRDNYQDFGMSNELRNLVKPRNSEILINKFPTFAFALVSNWKIFGRV